jgi:uncharacterized membrane protein
MHDDLARIAAGLPVASLWPLTVPYLAASRIRAGSVTAFSALYVLAPEIRSPSSLLLLLLAITIPLFLWSPNSEKSESPTTGWKGLLLAGAPVLAAALLGGAAVALTDLDQGLDALEAVIQSDRLALAATGLTAAVFIGGSVVAWILTPFTVALEKCGETPTVPSLSNAGRYIGWFERAVLFAFVIGGEPEAAAVALAAKSFARFPTLSEHHQGFAEYFLIGSLASITIAVGAAAATRAALGIGPF